MKNYLVTGAAGFIGSHVVDLLLERDDVKKIYVIDFLGEGSNIANLAKDPKVELIVRDLTSHTWQDRLPQIDYILHLAAESHQSINQFHLYFAELLLRKLFHLKRMM